MGQTLSFPHMHLPSRKTERLLLRNRETTSQHNNNNNNASFVRRSSMGGRLRSYGVILYHPSTPTTSSEAQGPTSEYDVAVSTPSPVVNDMISVRKRQWPTTSSKASSIMTTLTTTDHNIASKTPSVSSSSATTGTPRRQIGPAGTRTPVSAHAGSSSGYSDAIVSAPPKSRPTHDRTTLSSSLASSASSTATTVVCSRGNEPKSMLPQHSRLPKLRLGELEQIFAAIVTSDDSSTRAKIALSS